MIRRLRWELLPYVGYYLDGTPAWRWWMRLARWAWIALGWLPGSSLYAPDKTMLGLEVVKVEWPASPKSKGKR